MARREKKLVHHVQMTEEKRNIICQLQQKHDIESAQDIQSSLMDLFGGTIKGMIEGAVAKVDEYSTGVAAPFYTQNRKAGSEEPAFRGIINYDK